MIEIEKKRIEFIDLAKGICIVMVLAHHCKLPSIPGLELARMPFYFLLSGLFFKSYGGVWNFILKKTNKILLPFLFFALVGLAVSTLLNGWNSDNLLAPFMSGGRYPRVAGNGPIWFLVSLFNCGVIFALINRYIKSSVAQGVAVISIAAVGQMLYIFNIDLPLFFGGSLSALPFYWLGYSLKRTNLLYANRFDRYNLLIFAGFYLLSLLLSMFRPERLFDMRINHISILDYPQIVTSIFALLALYKAIGRVPWVSYVGRYSLIILCTHIVVMTLVSHYWGFYKYSLFASTIVICTILIPICRRFLPHFTAQRDLIKVDERR